MSDATKLTLYNSLTRSKEVFAPADPKRVTMYNCGPTVYSYAHIGNARAAVVADVLFRVLRHIYGEEHVIYARNITDVEDKIIAAASEQGEPISQITEKFARIYNEDLAAIGCLAPTIQPKATENIGGMIDMIQTLLDKDIAYASDGHVFFDVSKFDEYGKLSGNTLDALRGGERVGEGEVARKKNAADFVLWKPELDGVGWDASFGRGRPGWHIECSAMAKETLGETIDIHCGGVDLKFPHHENEIAQSQCAHNKPMARYWVHNEFLNMAKKDGSSEKMSKSLGNVTLIHDLLKDWDGEVIRLALLKAHYRSELTWSEALLKESKAQLDGWYRVLAKSRDKLTKGIDIDIKFTSLILNDLGTPSSISRVSSLSEIANLFVGVTKVPNQINTEGAPIEDVDRTKMGKFVKSTQLLGLLQKDPEDWFKGNASGDEQAKFDALAKARENARVAKDWAEADRVRDEAKALGIILEDGPDGTKWRKA